MLRQKQCLHRRIQMARRLNHQPHFVIAAQLALPPVAAFDRLTLHAGGKMRRQQGICQPRSIVAVGDRRQHQTQFDIHGKPHGATKNGSHCHTIPIPYTIRD